MSKGGSQRICAHSSLHEIRNIILRSWDVGTDRGKIRAAQHLPDSLAPYKLPEFLNNRREFALEADEVLRVVLFSQLG